MMGGMAYINGSDDRPQRAAPSVNDILGGQFGVIGALSALHERERTGVGKYVRAGLFETTLLLVAQFITQFELTGNPALPPRAARASLSPWSATPNGALSPPPSCPRAGPPVNQPHDLLKDPHLTLGGALMPTLLPTGEHVSTPALPLEFDGLKVGKRADPPQVGEHTVAILKDLGLDDEAIALLRQHGKIGG